MINFISKLKKRYSQKYFDLLFEIQRLNLNVQELEWAHHFQNSIKGKTHLNNLSLNVGRWAGNYSFFYVLHRILEEYKPKSILEFGLGESTKFISVFNEYDNIDATHVVIEHDLKWAEAYKLKNAQIKIPEIVIAPLVQKNIHGFEVNSYSGISDVINKKFSFYLIDGPWGSDRYSRYEIVEILSEMQKTDEFIILFDDTDRIGERDTLSVVKALLKEKGIEFHFSNYSGVKSCSVIGSKQFDLLTSF